jgi:hypothetical protein
MEQNTGRINEENKYSRISISGKKKVTATVAATEKVPALQFIFLKLL